MSHKHYCGVEGHDWVCTDRSCECICGNLMESGADHGECPIELRDCPVHQGQLPVLPDDELSPEDDVIMVNGRPAKLKDVRAVTINGRPTTLVIGREYEFKMKDGCSASLNVDDEPQP